MPKTDLQTIEQLKDQVYALQQLLLSFVVAFDGVDSDAVDAALVIAAGQADSAQSNGRPVAAARLSAMIKEIGECRS